MSGQFITVEGGEGAGKTTQMMFIRDYLERKGHRVVMTREPGGTPLGEEIRALLLEPRVGGMAPSAETLLMFAARAEHLEQVVRPALSAGYWVLCDRFTDATYAYQGGGRGLSLERIAVLEGWVQDELRPDLTLLFDVPVVTGLARAGRRGATDRFESEDLAFFERVWAIYRKRAALYPERYRIIDASQSIESVRIELESVLAAWLGQR